jgi:heme/copper-type cytochrome/quinol oxidase subunit 3
VNDDTAEHTIDVSHLPSAVYDTSSLLWWGVTGMIAFEGMMFALLGASYFYLRVHSPEWPPAPPPALLISSIGVGVLLVSLLPMHAAEKAAKDGKRRRAIAMLGVGIAMGFLFLGLRIAEWWQLPFRWDSHPYGSLVWITLGFHTLHLVTDLLDSIVVEVLMLLGWFGDEQREAVAASGVYWNFVVAGWLPLWAILYFVPRWG